MIRTNAYAWALTLALGAMSVGNAGCAGGGSAKTATIAAGNMPEGETWRGVYYHPVFGYLHIVEEGDNVVGRWKRSDQSAWGEMSGKKVGNLVHFEWKEHKYGLVGPSADTRGRGVFVYKLPSSGIAELDGQYGMATDEVGSDWHNVKQQRKEPDLQSINGDLAGAAPAAAGKWE